MPLTFFIDHQQSAVLGFLSYGAFAFAAVSLFRELLKAYGMKGEPHLSIVPPKIHGVLRFSSWLVIALVGAALGVLFIFVVNHENDALFNSSFWLFLVATIILAGVAIILVLIVTIVNIGHLIRKMQPRASGKMYKRDIAKIKTP